jgi:hypothetical protein
LAITAGKKVSPTRSIKLEYDDIPTVAVEQIVISATTQDRKHSISAIRSSCALITYRKTSEAVITTAVGIKKVRKNSKFSA